MTFSIRLVKDGILEIKEHDEVVAVYRYGKNLHKPYFYPVYAPGGLLVTRDAPPDHVHHRSLWTAHGDVNGVDLWGEADKSGFIKCMETPFVALSEDKCVLSSRNIWVSRDEKPLLEEYRKVTFWKTTSTVRLIDYEVMFHALYMDSTFGDTKEGGIISFRVADSMRESIGGGRIRNSEGGLGEPQCWGKRARWCDYTGKVNGNIAGITVLDHPNNPRHPTYWHVRAYGLFAANCFGISYFEHKSGSPGALTLEKNSKITFKYRAILHAGDIEVKRIEEYYEEYASSTQ